MSFDPNATGSADAGIFSLPYTREESKLILLPVPWEVTTSYGNGTSWGPDAIFECSRQIDLFHADTGTVYERGIYWDDSRQNEWRTLNDQLKPLAIGIKEALETGEELSAKHRADQEKINSQGQEFHQSVYRACREVLNQGKLLGLVGGDHSAPYGSIIATSEHHGRDVTVLHIDAHSDTRNAYQGYKHSHASIMRNIMEDPKGPKQLVQVGIRDFCQEEYDYTRGPNMFTFYDRDLKRRLAQGNSWHQVCAEIIKKIPTEKVYISFDIDGLNPTLCPNTGTPVPGGLEYDQVVELLYLLSSSKKKIVGFDLNEVAPDSPDQLNGWDGNVGSRVLYQLCCYTLFTND